MSRRRSHVGDGGELETINPFTGSLTGTWDEHTSGEIEEIIAGADGAFLSWRESSHDHRGELLGNLAGLLLSRKDDLARLMAVEMGKPVTQGRAEIEKCAVVCRFYAEKGSEFLQNIPVKTEAANSYVCHQPLGTIYAVMPWNFPFWQVFRFAAPAVMAGNSFVLKHSPNVTGCALEIGDLFTDAGFPQGLTGILLVSSDNVPRVSTRIVADRRVKAVTLTGGTRAGRHVASMAGQSLKRCVLELGGSDPAIILEDADLAHAARTCSFSRLINSGQNCIASKRFVAVEKIYDEFLELLVMEMTSGKMGDPMDESVSMGPLARYDLRDQLHRQVAGSVEMGAELLAGGRIPDLQGAFYPPTVLGNCRSGMPVFDEETFGPVAAVCRASDEDEALEIAGDTVFGLGASVFTRDTARGERIALGLGAGACFVNTFVRSDPRLPFGGTGDSGYGRELSIQGMLEFTNCKTVYIE